jgi:SAM-dependent methyltransferase
VTPLESDLLEILRSPDSARALTADGPRLVTANGAEQFPVVSGVPVLLGTESLFTVEHYTEDPDGPGASARVRALAKRMLPSLSHNLAAKRNYARLRDLLHDGVPEGTRRRVIVVGGSIVGEGFDVLLDDPSLDLVETDVARGPRTAIVCDAHFLPFADGVFDAVVCQAVLEHVADPPRVAAELRRVLRTGGLLYSEIPFMQQVHEGAHDFTRYSLTGHRRLFRDFDELDSGPTAGPGMALGWALRAFATGLVGGRPGARAAVNLLVTLTAFWLKYLDPLLLRHPAGLDGASGTYFLGRASSARTSDREIVAGYRGADDGFSLSR